MAFAHPFQRVTSFATTLKVKPTTFRYASLAEAVAALPCMKCGKVGRTQACHCNEGKGEAIKSTDASLFAACVECHSGIDQPGRGAMARDARRELERSLNLLTLRALIERGALRLAK